MENFLTKRYYLNSNNMMDDIVDSLGDCLVQAAYLVLKSKYGLRRDDYKAFLNETTVKLIVDSNNDLISFETVENMFDREVFSINSNSQTNQNTVETVSSVLKTGDIPAIATIIERFPFSAFYDINYKLNIRRTGHVFIIVGEDEENFFYVDNLSVISYKQYVAYEKNRGIGIISKKFFYEATKDYCDVLTFKFNKNVIDYYTKHPQEALINSKDNYFKNEVYYGNFIEYFGRNALIKLIELFETEKLRFDALAPSEDRDMITYFNWKLWNIKGRRNLQRYYLEQNNNNNALKLIKSLKESIKHWDLLYKILYKDYLQGAVIMGKKYIPVIENVIAVEDELHEALVKYLSLES